MAYQAKRTERIYEELELLDENDQVVHTLRVYLDADTMLARNLNDKSIELTKAYQEMAACKGEKEKEITMERVGHILHSLYKLVFGEENTKTILGFYEGRMTEMCLEVNPFINEIIVPRVRDMVNETKRRANYKYNRNKVRGSGIFRR